MSDPDPRGPQTPSRTRFWMLIVIASRGMFLGVLDTTMMNVAGPAIGRAPNTTVSATER
ncbi:hypothetical protein [Halalkalicoccus jeotgali]|nr:hypothetical protein [Halalkalicoccus jeotgali]